MWWWRSQVCVSRETSENSSFSPPDVWPWENCETFPAPLFSHLWHGNENSYHIELSLKIKKKKVISITSLTQSWPHSKFSTKGCYWYWVKRNKSIWWGPAMGKTLFEYIIHFISWESYVVTTVLTLMIYMWENWGRLAHDHTVNGRPRLSGFKDFLRKEQVYLLV